MWSQAAGVPSAVFQGERLQGSHLRSSASVTQLPVTIQDQPQSRGRLHLPDRVLQDPCLCKNKWRSGRQAQGTVVGARCPEEHSILHRRPHGLSWLVSVTLTSQRHTVRRPGTCSKAETDPTASRWRVHSLPWPADAAGCGRHPQRTWSPPLCLISPPCFGVLGHSRPFPSDRLNVLYPFCS